MIGITEAMGSSIPMKTTDKRHFGVVPSQSEPGDFMSKFTQAIKGAVEDTNNLQVTSDRMSLQMITQPNSIDAHDVMIAAEKAQMSLSLTKNILNKTVEAYNAITNLR